MTKKHWIIPLILTTTLFYTCEKDQSEVFNVEEPMLIEIDPNAISICAVTLSRFSFDLANDEAWDEDGSAPDIFVEVYIGSGLVFSSDTFYNISQDTVLRFEFEDEELLIGNANSQFRVIVSDYDPLEPGIPPVFGSNDAYYDFRRNLWSANDPPYYDNKKFITSLNSQLNFGLSYQFIE